MGALLLVSEQRKRENKFQKLGKFLLLVIGLFNHVNYTFLSN